jgi:hypothetical protein
MPARALSVNSSIRRLSSSASFRFVRIDQRLSRITSQLHDGRINRASLRW